MKFIHCCLLLIFFGIYSVLCAATIAKKPPVRLILDTDIGPDYDDVGAISLGASQHWPEMILKKYPHKVKSTADVPSAVVVYRKILASQPNHSVTIATIGFLTNLANLLKSEPDQYSSLNGKELVKLKVKELISKAGWFPKGREFNLYTDSASSKAVFLGWPGKIIFSGFEIGKQIKTGSGLLSDKSLKSPVKDVFAFCMPKSAEDVHGRLSWDETAVLVITMPSSSSLMNCMPRHRTCISTARLKQLANFR